MSKRSCPVPLVPPSSATKKPRQGLYTAAEIASMVAAAIDTQQSPTIQAYNEIVQHMKTDDSTPIGRFVGLCIKLAPGAEANVFDDNAGRIVIEAEPESSALEEALEDECHQSVSDLWQEAAVAAAELGRSRFATYQAFVKDVLANTAKYQGIAKVLGCTFTLRDGKLEKKNAE